MNNQQTELTIEQKLALLNGLKVIDWESGGEECVYVLVADDTTTRDVLNKVLDDRVAYFEQNEDLLATEDHVDISLIGFEVLGAKWWHIDKGFHNTEPILGA